MCLLYLTLSEVCVLILPVRAHLERRRVFVCGPHSVDAIFSFISTHTHM